MHLQDEDQTVYVLPGPLLSYGGSRRTAYPASFDSRIWKAKINPESPEMAVVNPAGHWKMTDGENVGYLSKRMANVNLEDFGTQK